MIEPIEVGKRIKERREELGLTQEQLGKEKPLFVIITEESLKKNSARYKQSLWKI